MNKISLVLLDFYQIYLSPIFGGNCRFYPSCSKYAKESFDTHTFSKAMFLTLKRVLKCHPLGKQGYDPVPEANQSIGFRKAKDLPS